MQITNEEAHNLGANIKYVEDLILDVFNVIGSFPIPDDRLKSLHRVLRQLLAASANLDGAEQTVASLKQSLHTVETFLKVQAIVNDYAKASLTRLNGGRQSLG